MEPNTSIQPRLSTYVRGRLRIARTEVELTQAQVAERMGVTQTAVSYWESGERQIGLDELFDFAMATNQPVEFFLPPLEPLPSDHDRKMRVVEAQAYDDLRDAAMWVVLTWDTDGTQAATMPSLRRALGLPSARPYRDEALQRLAAYSDEVMFR